MKRTKKGQADIGQMPAIAMSLIILLVVLAIGFFIVMEFRDSADYTATVVTNETINVTGLTDTDIALTYGNIQSIQLVINTTESTEIPSSNYTFKGNWTASSINLTYENSDVLNVSYTYNVPTESATAIHNSLVGLSKFSDWMGLIVIVIVAAIIMGLVGFMQVARRT